MTSIIMSSKSLPSHLQCKIMNDPIHGHIELHPLVVKIIDTPQFQRLRYIHQLGACYYVFPGATHKRFEHCIGVCHLARKMLQVLHHSQPELRISEEDMLCVQIAGLCHDLGHGPFSHLFDKKFLRTVNKDKKEKWSHEIGSVRMFDYLVKENKLDVEFARHNLGEKDLNFIKALILGPSKETEVQTSEQHTGRGSDKIFLYEIVANKRTGIDVDKWDYFARDAYNVGIRSNFDHERLMKFIRVLEVDGQRQICYREKECSNIYEMFHMRALLHRQAYQHKTSCAIEEMISEALIAANDFITMTGRNGVQYKMSEAVTDMAAYMKLTDHIYHQILHSTQDDLAPARHLLDRIERRDLYRVIGQAKLDHLMPEEEIKQGILSAYDSLRDDPDHVAFTLDDIGVFIVTLDYGMKDKNPIEKVHFYKKDKPDEAFTITADEVLHIMPGKFLDRSLRVFSKKTDSKTVETVRACFCAWCEARGLTVKV